MTLRRAFSWSVLSLSCVVSASNAQTIIRHTLTVASNPSLRVTNNEVDTIIAEMNRILRTKSYTWDVSCPDVEFVRGGNVIQSTDLPISGTYDDLAGDLRSAAPNANVFVVSGLDCGIVSGAAGCGNIGVEPLVAGQTPGFDAQLWLHERGHNVGLPHSAESPSPDTSVAQNIGMRFMFWQLGIGHVGKTAGECSDFEHPIRDLRSVVAFNPSPAVGAAAPAAAAQPSGGSGQTILSAAAYPDFEQQLKDAAEKAGLTLPAYKVVGPPWVHGMPVDQIKGLSGSDIDSIRSMLRGSLNPYWAQAINTLAVVGNTEDAALIKRTLDQPMAAVPPTANQEVIQQLRDLLKAKLAAPQALGILANRTKSSAAVDILKDTADLDTASALVGKAASVDLSRNALTGLSIANTPEAQEYLAPKVGAQPDVPPNSDVQGTRMPERKIAPLTPQQADRLKSISATVQRVGIENFLKQ